MKASFYWAENAGILVHGQGCRRLRSPAVAKLSRVLKLVRKEPGGNDWGRKGKKKSSKRRKRGGKQGKIKTANFGFIREFVGLEA